MVAWFSRDVGIKRPALFFLGGATGSRPKRITLSQQGITGRGVRMDSASGIRWYVVVVELAEAVLEVPKSRVLLPMRNPAAMICFCGFDDIRRIK